MATVQGQPTQFHSVPLDDRAYDVAGKRLPWALEWPDDHPNARGQRRQAEEKGPFGKSVRARKTSSRATRTATPAKREDPTLDGFEAALKHDAQRRVEQQQVTMTAANHNDSNTIGRQPLSVTKEPTQLIFYGFGSNSQWAAISFYESASGGIICEDYERQPPCEGRRVPNTYSNTTYTQSRPLTQAERMLAAQYHGGDHWIKVTFDSVEAAKRAMDLSPHLIQGHFVYAVPFKGQDPELDEPIIATDEDRAHGTPVKQKPRTIGPSYSQPADTQGRHVATLPRSFQTSDQAVATQQQQEQGSFSPSTASSATATEVHYPDLRSGTSAHLQSQPAAATGAEVVSGSVQHRAFMTHFPDMPKTMLRPATEALLPQPTWWEWFTRYLETSGFIPRDIIGNGVPRLENGDLDRSKASFYWRFCHWLDKSLGTDLCGLKDSE